MAVTPLNLQLAEIPTEGLHLEGEVGASVFDLRDKLAAPKSPLRYVLDVSSVDGYLILQGRLSATFELVCALTTVTFEEEIVLDPYLESIELDEIGETLDLTDQLREDILLALPAYPKAPGAESEVRFSPSVSTHAVEQDTEEDRRSAWDALDGLKTND